MCKSKGTAGLFMSTVCLYDLSLDSLRAENNIAVIAQCHRKVFLWHFNANWLQLTFSPNPFFQDRKIFCINFDAIDAV